MMLALRRAGHRLEIVVRDHNARTDLKLDHCFTPTCALQQAVCDVADGVSLDEARAKLSVDIRTWKATIGHAGRRRGAGSMRSAILPTSCVTASGNSTDANRFACLGHAVRS
ncbi:hypothetical protein D3C71_1892430 [compost metagenome]